MSRERSGPFARLLELAALCGFAVLQPLLDLLARDTGFLVARKSSALEIVALVLGLALLPPLLLWGVERIAAGFSARAEKRVHGIGVALLAMMIAAPIIARFESVPASLDLTLIVVIGVVVNLLMQRAVVLRSSVRLLALAPFLFGGLFFSDDGIAMLMNGAKMQIEDAAEFESQPPIVMLVLDELGLHSLLDERGQVDSVRYPAFARLAHLSHWFRNATAVDWRTLQVIPSLLSGRYPGMEKRLAIVAEHPRTLFSLLAPHYDLNIVESQTQLYEQESAREDHSADFVSLCRDLGLIYLHIVVPERFAERFPSVRHTWKDFGTGLGALDILDPHGNRVEQFRAFVHSIERTQAPGLHFLHSLLPHSPWQIMPSGGVYAPGNFDGNAFEQWLDEEWWVVQAQQRHLLQLQFTDRLLGELLDHLERIGIWDEALVIVTADHGVSFWPGDNYRDPAGSKHPEDILNVPLFIKEPRQHRGVVHEQNVETVDVLPLILGFLGIPPPWEMDGCSLLVEACDERPEKVAFSSREYKSEDNQRLTYPADLGLRSEGLRRKLGLFGTGRSPGALFRIGPHPELLGRDVAAFVVSDRREDFKLVLSKEARVSEVPLRVHGFLEFEKPVSPEESIVVAIAIAGRIEAVVPALTDGRNPLREMVNQPIKPERIVSAMIPESIAHGRVREDLRVYRVHISGELPTLVEIAVE